MTNSHKEHPFCFLTKDFPNISTLCIYKKFAPTKEDSKGGTPLVVLGVGVYRGGGIARHARGNLGFFKFKKVLK